jgi:hypothetical protein
MFGKHYAHFELPKVKVTAIKLFHDFQGLHLKRRHFEHKCYNKHSLKKLKAFEEIFDPSRKLEKKKLLSLAKSFITQARNFTLSTTQRPFFHTPQTFNEWKNSLAHTLTLKLDTFKKT